MASRQSVNSILKPSKVRAPLKEIEPVDQDDDENTESLPKRKVSFSGMNKIKMYNTGATSLTVHQAPMFDEQISILSDSSNAEKTKLLEASQKSDYQMTSESNCTTVGDNNYVNKEYECQNDNMEMTEALSCKIFSDAVYTIDNNSFKYGGEYNSDNSDSNMEFTEVIKSAQIITHENELDFSSTETFNDKDEHTNVQSSNMELTCVTGPQKSILQYYESDMELTKLTTRTIHKNNNCELFFEQDQHSISTASETTSEISMDIDPTLKDNEYDVNVDNAKLVISEQNNSFVPLTTEYKHNINIDPPRISIVSTGLSFKNEMLVTNINKPEEVEELKEESLNGITSAADQCQSLKDNKIKNYSRKTMAHTPLIVQEKSTKNRYLSNTPVVEENDQESFTESSTKFVLEQTQSLEKEKKPNTLVMSNSPTSFYNESLQSFEDEDNILDTPVIVETNRQKIYSRKSVTDPVLIFNESQYPENEETSNISVMVEENQQMSYSEQSSLPVTVETNQQKRYSRKSVAAPMLIFNESQYPENEETSNISVMVEENQQMSYSEQSNLPVTVETIQHKSYSRKSVDPASVSNQSRSTDIGDLSDTFALVEGNYQRRSIKSSIISVPNKPKKYSRKTLGPSSIFVHSESPNDSMSDYNLVGAECSKSSSKMSMTCVTTEFVNDISPISNNSNIQSLDVSNKHKEKLISKIDHESVLPNMIDDDDLNSPFRKKSRLLSVALTNLSSETAYESHLSEDYEDTSKMDISIELSKDNSILNISSEDVHKIPSSSSPLNDILLVKKTINKDGQFLIFPNDSFEEKSEASDKFSRKEKYINNLAVDDKQFQKNSETPKEVVKNDHLKITDNINLTNHILKPEDNSFPLNVDGITNEICIEGISNISISEETHKNYENSLTENRKRSYSNRDVNCVESAMENVFKVVPMKEEQLNNEVLEFLTRWEGQFIDKLLVQVKCTNSKWVFSALDGIIVLTITYLPILKDHTFLKVEDITFTTKTIQHEIIKFGMNWILSKYNPKVYKQVCFSSRDIELLLKSLLEDVQFIAKVMDNMFYIGDLYCVTFKDNVAQIVLHSMKCLSMTCIQISLSNIHKLSVKDITVDCLFGFFNTNLLNDILEKLPKDYNILESLIIQLKDQMYS